jgi:hypothetical protein
VYVRDVGIFRDILALVRAFWQFPHVLVLIGEVVGALLEIFWLLFGDVLVHLGIL